MTTESRNEETKRREDKLLWILIGVPILILLIAAGGPALLKGMKNVLSVVVPNFWVLLVYVYIAFMFYVIGRRHRK